MRLNFSEGALRISAGSAEQEEAVDEIEIDYTAAPLELSFNVNFLTEMLTGMSGHDMVTFAMKNAGDTNNSVLITVPDDANFKYVVMPMRL